MTMFTRAKEPEQNGLRSTMPLREAEPVKRDAVASPELQRPVVRPQTPAVPPKPAVAPARVSAPIAAPHSAPATPAAETAATDAAPVRTPVTAPKPAVPPSPNAAMLVAGAGVTLKGNMQCDMLRVEGSIEGDVKARKLMISAGGTLMGTAEIEDAEVEGLFEGTLIVSGHLVVRSTGRLTGKFQYGEIEIERGGAITGEVQMHGQAIV
jgi:cytoskeletal protein CcmA (bactofilin family)